MPITVARRIGHWTTEIDDTLIMGGAPFGFAKIPDKLYHRGVRGVVNLCEEYRGPEASYRRLGMRHLRLPTTDHFEPTVQDMERAVEFIRFHEQMGKKVYVHCRAGHGRSAAVALAWLVSKSPDTVDLKTLNQKLLQLRDVRKTLWKQRNIIRFHARLRRKDADDDDDDKDEIDNDTYSYDGEL
jgi:atypical dual specificity phosphatase